MMIWNCATCKVLFMYRSLILAEYEHHVIMSLQFPSDFNFLWGGHFSRCLLKILIFSREVYVIPNNFKILKLLKFNYLEQFHFSNKFRSLNEIDIFIFKNLFFVEYNDMFIILFFRKIFIFSGIFVSNRIYSGSYLFESIALRVPPAETRLTVYRRFET